MCEYRNKERTSHSLISEGEQFIRTGMMDSVAKAGGAIGGDIAVVESHVNGDDFEETIKHTISGTMKGTLSGGTSAVTINGMNMLLSGLPFPMPSKVVIVLGNGIVNNTVVGNLAGDAVFSIVDGIEDLFDSLAFFW